MLKASMSIALVAAGCAHSSQAMYGTEARYEPDSHMWTARKGAASWVFRNPLTGCALQCRDNVVRWAGLAAKNSQMNNQRNGSFLTGVLVTLPLSIPGAVLLLPAYGVSTALTPSSAAKFHHEGDAALKKNDRDAAIEAYVLAVEGGDMSAIEPLAQIWEKGDNIEDARSARQLLLCTGTPAFPLGAAEWSRIEDWLRSHDGTVPTCSNKSREPVEIKWDD